jgi:hypothetical protein
VWTFAILGFAAGLAVGHVTALLRRREPARAAPEPASTPTAALDPIAGYYDRARGVIRSYRDGREWTAETILRREA